MAKIVIISYSGDALPLAYRMGAAIYVHSPAYWPDYEGVIDRVRIGSLKKAVAEAEVVLFDGLHLSTGSKQDIALLKIFECPRYGQGLFGPVSLMLSQDTVIGACPAAEETVAAEEERPRRDFPGLEISAGLWIGKDSLAHHYWYIESDSLNNGGTGLKMGAQSNTLWAASQADLTDNPIFEALTRRADLLQNAGYLGPLRVVCVLAKDTEEILYAKWIPGFDYSGLFCFLELLNVSPEKFFTQQFAGAMKEGFAVSQRISIPPYPYTNRDLLSKHAQGVKIEGRLDKLTEFWMADIKVQDNQISCAGVDGLLGGMITTGASPAAAWGACYRQIKKLKVDSPLQYRTDGHKVARKRLDALRKRGYANA